MRERTCVRGPDVEVLAAVAGRGVHEAGAGVGGDVGGGEQRDIEVVTHRAKRMRANNSFGKDARSPTKSHLSMMSNGTSKFFGKKQKLTWLCKRTLTHFSNFVYAVLDRFRKRDCAIAGDCPRRGGPDNHGRML